MSEVIDICNSEEDKAEEKGGFAAASLEHHNYSFGPEYEEDPTNPVPGDLVVTSLSDMRYPARRDTNFGGHFLIVLIRCWVQKYWNQCCGGLETRYYFSVP